MCRSGQVIAIQKSRTVIQIESSRSLPWQAKIEACGQSVALVVIEKAQCIARVPGYETAGDDAGPLRILMRIPKMDTRTANIRRFDAGFPAANTSMFKRQRKENVRDTKCSLVDEIVGAGAETEKRRTQ